MCGRFVSSIPVSKLVEQFLVEDVRTQDHAPSWNVAPTDDVLAVAESREGTRRLGTFRWGLVPSWAEDPSVGNRLINLRRETLAEKATFRRLVARRRCILPADGFYEWKAMGRGRRKQPFFVRSRDGSALALAGLWEVWRDPSHPDGEWLRTCAIVTTEPNELIAPLHDRMPVVLPPDAWEAWLDRDNDDVEGLLRLLAPPPPGLLELYPVSTEVNDVRNNGAQLVLPLEGHQVRD